MSYQHAAAVVVSMMCLALGVSGQQAPARSATNLGTDASGNPLRLALKTGHVSNYDEAKVRPYVLPDPLLLPGGARVSTARDWRQRRAEIVRLYETEIYGRVPQNAPKVSWQVGAIDRTALAGTAVMKQVVGVVGTAPGGPRINLSVYTPANAAGRVPLVLMVNFGGGDAAARGRGVGVVAVPGSPAGSEILARGWGFATVGYQDIQPDRADAWTEGVIGLTLAAGHTQPAPDQWGTISAWAWGISRIVDYLETDRSVNPRQIAIQGHSRLGKTVLWAAAKDERIAAVFSRCAGEMGSALARRDWGETVDDMAQNFAWQFAGNLQKWVGRWNDMPVDAHMLIALSAPRPVFVSGGTTDQWSDPVGEFLATVAAGPVYRLLGRKDLGVTQLPPLDSPVIGGDLGWHYHTGGHTATPADWNAYLQFLANHFKE